MPGKLAYPGAESALTAALSGRYLALLTGAPSGPGAALSSLSEYVADGYSRQAVSFGVATGTPRTAANTNTVSTPPITGANGAIELTHWALVSVVSGTSGTVIAYGEIDDDGETDRAPASGDAVIFTPGSLTISID